MHLVLLLLDPESPVPDVTLREARRYVEAFFRLELRVVEVPKLAIAPAGWKALLERVHEPIRHRQVPAGSGMKWQLSSADVLKALRKLRLSSDHGVEVVDAECIVGITGCELYESSFGSRPEEAIPADRLQLTVQSVTDRVAAVSFQAGRRPGAAHQRLELRQLLTMLTHSFMTLLGLRTCEDHRCLAYRRIFHCSETAFCLCADSEVALLKRVMPGALRNELILAAADRYRELSGILDDFGHRLQPLKLSRRVYAEFEEERDWYKVAEELLLEGSKEKKHCLDQSGNSRLRSFPNCVAYAHEGQPARTMKRTFSEPMLKTTCLLDMTSSRPYCQEKGDLIRWSQLVTNRKHSAGGLYVEMGGSLKPKTLGMFLDSGLNASLLRDNKSATLPGLTGVRNRTGRL